MSGICLLYAPNVGNIFQSSQLGLLVRLRSGTSPNTYPSSKVRCKDSGRIVVFTEVSLAMLPPTLISFLTPFNILEISEELLTHGAGSALHKFCTWVRFISNSFCCYDSMSFKTLLSNVFYKYIHSTMNNIIFYHLTLHYP